MKVLFWVRLRYVLRGLRSALILGTFRDGFEYFLSEVGPYSALICILGDCVSLLHIQTEMDEIESGEFGIALDWIERGFLPGDVIKCFYLDSESREPDWVWQ